MSISHNIKICLKLQIPYYVPLTEQLQRAVNGNQEQLMMSLQGSEVILYLQWIEHYKTYP